MLHRARPRVQLWCTKWPIHPNPPPIHPQSITKRHSNPPPIHFARIPKIKPWGAKKIPKCSQNEVLGANKNACEKWTSKTSSRTRFWGRFVGQLSFKIRHPTWSKQRRVYDGILDVFTPAMSIKVLTYRSDACWIPRPMARGFRGLRLVLGGRQSEFWVNSESQKLVFNV